VPTVMEHVAIIRKFDFDRGSVSNWRPLDDVHRANDMAATCSNQLNVFLVFRARQVKSKGKELYAAVARHMSSLGMKSSDIFGLAIQIGEFYFGLRHSFALRRCWLLPLSPGRVHPLHHPIGV
jgi:hypothetical protein